MEYFHEPTRQKFTVMPLKIFKTCAEKIETGEWVRNIRTALLVTRGSTLLKFVYYAEGHRCPGLSIAVRREKPRKCYFYEHAPRGHCCARSAVSRRYSPLAGSYSRHHWCRRDHRHRRYDTRTAVKNKNRNETEIIDDFIIVKHFQGEQNTLLKRFSFRRTFLYI